MARYSGAIRINLVSTATHLTRVFRYRTSLRGELMELKVPLEKLQVDFDTSVRMSDPITFFQGRDTFATTKGGSPRNLAKLRGYDLS